jgi:hypothetical protein
MEINFLALISATLVPMVLGFIWYNPRIGFGRAWMLSSGMTPDKAKNANMPVVFGLTTLFAFFIAFSMQSIVIHQSHVAGLLMTQPDYREAGSTAEGLYNSIMEHYGDSYRTFKHGFFHGTLAGFMLALPIIGTNAIFEGRGFRYVAINAGFWIVSMAFMGGIVAALT